MFQPYYYNIKMLNHIRELYLNTQSDNARFNPDTYMNHLDLNNDLPLAIFMIKLLSPKIKFIKTDNSGNCGHGSGARAWERAITFHGVCPDSEQLVPRPPSQTPRVRHTKLRYYLQKTLLDEIAKELIEEKLQGILHDDVDLLVLLKTIISNICTAEKLDTLLNSIKDVIYEDLQ